MDREPWFGCNFNVGIAHPAGDPLAPGRTVAATEVFDVQPRGRIDGQFVTPPLARGTYFLEYGGDEPCDWVVRVVPGP